jgi:predicted ATPase
MINKLSIQNFKSLKDSGMLDLKPVNVLTGLNGVGKSSLIQALLLFRQSTELSKELRLRNGLVNIGTIRDALFQSADKEEISLRLNDFQWSFDASIPDDDVLKTTQGKDYSTHELSELSVFGDHFQYISADRVSQVEMHEVSRSNISKAFLGIRGEYTVHFLEAVESGSIKFETPRILRHASAHGTDLRSQVNHWLGEISPNTKVVTKQITNEQVQLGFSFGQSQNNPFKPKNVGFGLSYALSVVTALLISKPNSLIIIENPEAHLHPKGQAKLAELMCLAAKNGAQIIVETHSDHILNGVRVMVRSHYDDNRSGISNEKVAIFWFERNEEDLSADIVPIRLEPNAKIKKAPLGFFDQMDIDLKRILGF